jgi:hypothetical protein
VKDLGEDNWNAVAAVMKGGRTGPACLGQWITKLKPGITRGNWSAEEDAALLSMYESKTHNTWVKRSIELGRLFHNGHRRGGAETCSRYFLLKKRLAGTAAPATAPKIKSAVAKKVRAAKREPATKPVKRTSHAKK